MRRFPGKLRVDRFAVTGRPLRAAQYGGLLELVVRLGSVVVRAADRQDERAAARRPVLRDGVRRRAAAAQRGVRARRAPVRSGLRRARVARSRRSSGYPVQDLAHALVRARRAVHSTDPEVVARGRDGDRRARRRRLDRRSDRRRSSATIAAASTFARRWSRSPRRTSARTRRSGASGTRRARRRHRIEWLIDGLSPQGRSDPRGRDQRSAPADRRVLRLPPRSAAQGTRRLGRALGRVVARDRQAPVRDCRTRTSASADRRAPARNRDGEPS